MAAEQDEAAGAPNWWSDNLVLQSLVGMIFPLVFTLIMRKLRKRPLKPLPGERILLVTAHPDDEAMFFSPFLLSSSSTAQEISLLCLSTGNFDGLGQTRARELKAAAGLLGLGSEEGSGEAGAVAAGGAAPAASGQRNQKGQKPQKGSGKQQGRRGGGRLPGAAAAVVIVDHPELQDGMDANWDPRLVAKMVAGTVARHQIQTVVTFDEYGISGHPNHISVSQGCQLWAAAVWKAGAKPLITAGGSTKSPRQRRPAAAVEETKSARLSEVELTDGKQLLALASAAAEKALERKAKAEAVAGADEPAAEGAADGVDEFRLFTLESTNIARKFGGLADALWSANHPWLFLTPSGGFYRTHKAMAAHQSQWVWYRRVFLFFSRYTHMNTLTELGAREGGLAFGAEITKRKTV